jgi:hypothetical protein
MRSSRSYECELIESIRSASLMLVLREVNLELVSGLRWDYPLNLSISLSGGKETNRDGLSNGE